MMPKPLNSRAHIELLRKYLQRLQQTVPCPYGVMELYDSIIPPSMRPTRRGVVDALTFNMGLLYSWGTDAGLVFRNSNGQSKGVQMYFAEPHPVPATSLYRPMQMFTMEREHPFRERLEAWWSAAYQLHSTIDGVILHVEGAMREKPRLLAAWPEILPFMRLKYKPQPNSRKKLISGYIPQETIDIGTQLLAQATLLPDLPDSRVWITHPF